MRTPYNPNQSPRVIIIQKLYGNFFNDDTDLTFPKHRFKKFIKDVVIGTIAVSYTHLTLPTTPYV